MTHSKLLLATLIIALSGCSTESSKYPSSQGKPKPYILKEGCKFTITEERSKASVTSPTVSGMEGATASTGASLGDKSIMVADCKVINNSHHLPIYED